MKSFMQGVLGAVLVLLVAAFFMPLYANYTQRTISNEILISLGSYQKEIEKSLKNQTPIQPITTGEQGKYIEFVRVQADGTITAKAKINGQVLLLVPSVNNAEVIWKCIGGPNKNVPANCRST